MMTKEILFYYQNITFLGYLKIEREILLFRLLGERERESTTLTD